MNGIKKCLCGKIPRIFETFENKSMTKTAGFHAECRCGISLSPRTIGHNWSKHEVIKRWNELHNNLDEPERSCPHYFEGTDGVHRVVIGRCNKPQPPEENK